MMSEDVQRPRPRIFYGWYIVGVGFLANTAGVFSLSSTLGVFLKPLTEDLGVSRGVFSLLRSGESLISASLSPLVGSMMDRHGGRWLMTWEIGGETFPAQHANGNCNRGHRSERCDPA